MQLACMARFFAAEITGNKTAARIKITPHETSSSMSVYPVLLLRILHLWTLHREMNVHNALERLAAHQSSDRYLPNPRPNRQSRCIEVYRNFRPQKWRDRLVISARAAPLRSRFQFDRPKVWI